MSEAEPQPPTRLTPTTLDVLEVLVRGPSPTYAYAVAGRTAHPISTVTQILIRLEKRGWLVSAWQDNPEENLPRRRYYGFTPEARRLAVAILEGQGRI